MVINKFIFMQLLFFDYQWSLLFLLSVGIRVVQFQNPFIIACIVPEILVGRWVSAHCYD